MRELDIKPELIYKHRAFGGVPATGRKTCWPNPCSSASCSGFGGGMAATADNLLTMVRRRYQGDLALSHRDRSGNMERPPWAWRWAVTPESAEGHLGCLRKCGGAERSWRWPSHDRLAGAGPARCLGPKKPRRLQLPAS